MDAGIEAPGGQLITALNYNQDAQLSAVDAGSTTLASYTYNGFGQRVLKAFPGGTGEIYQYGQNGMLLEETDQSGTPQADYIYLNGRPIATLNPATGTLYFLQDDRLGTPQLATDSGQSVAWQAAYGPFGQASVSGSITQNLRFPGAVLRHRNRLESQRIPGLHPATRKVCRTRSAGHAGECKFLQSRQWPSVQ